MELSSSIGSLPEVMRKKSAEATPTKAPNAVPKAKQCGFLGARGACVKLWGSCPYHPSQKKAGGDAHLPVRAEPLNGAFSPEEKAEPAKPKPKEESKEEEEESDLESFSEAEDPCEICGEHNRPHEMLECDGCSKGFHMFCLTPPMTKIPDNDWFCSDCVRSNASVEKGDQIDAETMVPVPPTPTKKEEEEEEEEAEAATEEASVKEEAAEESQAVMEEVPVKTEDEPMEEEEEEEEEVIPSKLTEEVNEMEGSDAVVALMTSEEPPPVLSEPPPGPAPGKGKSLVTTELGWDYQTQLTARIVTDVYIHWLKRVVRLGRPLMKLGDARMCDWLLEASDGTIYYEEPIPRPMDHDREEVEAKKRDVAAGKKKLVPPPVSVEDEEDEEMGFANQITSINPTGAPICGVLSKRNNPCGQPKATCRYHGPLEFRYKTGDGPLRPAAMVQPKKKNPGFLGGLVNDDEFLNDDDDEAEEEDWLQDDDEEDLYEAFGSELFQQARREESPGVLEEEEEEEEEIEELQNIDVERAATNKFLQNLERFQMTFGHKNMPNVIYMHDDYELLLQ